MPDPRVAHCVFCDDVRQELGNKLSLMGIYVGELIIAAVPPVVMPKFVIVVWVISDVDDPIKRVVTRVLMPPDGTEVLKVEAGEVITLASHMEGARKVIAHQIVSVGNFMISAPGMMEVMLETDTGPLRAGRLLIRFVDPPQAGGATLSPIASPPPSEQSPPDAPTTKPRASRHRPSTRRTERTPEPE
jgi:hypothetical protein